METVSYTHLDVYKRQEVIYINLSAGGSVKDIYDVNIFGTGDITA